MGSTIQKVIKEWDIEAQEINQIYHSAWQIGTTAVLKLYEDLNIACS